MAKLIFISHRHDDREIASSFNKHFQLWSVPADEIFQSSDYRSSTVIGEPLRPQLRQALGEARLVLLIYTSPDEDWEFCIWECGVATDPTDESPETRIAVFQAGELRSRVFEDEVVLKLTQEDLRKFVSQFHKHVGFFRQGVAFQKDVRDDILEKRADDLYEDLRRFAPPGRREERFRWDRFTLALAGGKVRAIRDLKDRHERHQMIKSEAAVVHFFGQALRHFGYTEGARDLTLLSLEQRWLQANQSDPDTPKGWIAELCEEIYRSLENIPAEPTWELMRSVVYPGWWFYPILNHTRVNPDGSFQFDVYMYRLPGALPTEVALAPAL